VVDRHDFVATNDKERGTSEHHALAPRVAIYVRVSSEQQAQEQTIATQVAGLRQRVADEGFALSDELSFLDEGVSGSTLMRPALETRNFCARNINGDSPRPNLQRPNDRFENNSPPRNGRCNV
jgi:hypothetical protein